MAGGPSSNYEAEIKKGMKGQSVSKTPAPSQPAGMKSSENAAPSGKPPASSGKQNQWNQPSGPTSGDGIAQGANGDTHAQMIAAGHAHMAAIHNHITAISSGKGAGGDGGVNGGTVNE